MGDRTFAAVFAGDGLIGTISPALEHLRLSEKREPDFQIAVWDSTSTKTAMPRPAWRPNAYEFEGQIRGFNDKRFKTYYNNHVFQMVDLQRRQGIYWTADCDKIPEGEIKIPLRTALHCWLINDGLHMLHAGAVGNEHGGVLLAGACGSGKSSTTLACLLAGFDYLGDDFILMDMMEEKFPPVYSLYCTAKLETAYLHAYPELIEYVSNPVRAEEEKAVFFVNQFLPKQICKTLPVKAIILPRVVDQEFTTVEPDSAAAALEALIPSTVFQLQGGGEKTLKNTSALVKRMPIFRLNLGRKRDEIPRVISELLATLKG